MNQTINIMRESWQCDFPGCFKVLNSNFSLRRHVQLMHEQGKRFACRYCGKAFSLKQYLLEHEYMHTNELPFLCGVDGCPERFRQRGKLCLHRRTHEGYETRRYKYPDLEERKKKRQERKKKRRNRQKAPRANDQHSPDIAPQPEIAH